MGTAPAPVTSADVIFFASVISRVSGDVAASDTSAVANTSNANRVRILTSPWSLILINLRRFRNSRRALPSTPQVFPVLPLVPMP